MISVLVLQDPLNVLPPKASTFTDDVDGVYYLTLWICAFFFVLVTGILLYSVIKWRRRTPEQPAASSVTHNTTLEVVWTLIPLVIMMVLFAWGWKGSLDMTTAPADALQYQVRAKQWEWHIWHPGQDPSPDGDSPAINEMWVPLGANVKLTTYSDDVLHAFYVPAFRVKRDVIPGRFQKLWWNANKLSPVDPETGQSIGFPILCAEYCGRNHSYMLGKVHVVTQEEFDKKPWDLHPAEPAAWGEWLYKKQCFACHSLDGSRLVGPSFKGLWSKGEETLSDGTTVKIDRDYVAESIRKPQAKIVKGYEDAGNMTAFAFKDDQIDAIVAFLKSDALK